MSDTPNKPAAKNAGKKKAELEVRIRIVKQTRHNDGWLLPGHEMMIAQSKAEFYEKQGEAQIIGL